jgi:anti-sigma regulatory factor (Ser/Thr protein kinase)
MNAILEKFLTYPYGRFPVVDDGYRVVGVITKGDLALAILQKFGTIYLHNKRMDDVLTMDPSLHRLEELGEDHCFFFTIENEDLDTAGGGAAELKRLLSQRGFAKELVQKVSISCYEAEVNVVIHAGGKGKIRMYSTPDIIFLFVEDWGPGIHDVELAMKEGYSTASDEVREHGFGAGMGLPNMRKYADKLVVLSDSGGTKIEMLFLLTQAKQGQPSGEQA